MTILGRSEKLVSRCVECDLAEPESLASLGGSAPGVVDGILSVTRGKCDFGGATLNNPSLGCIYVLPRLWDPGGVSSSANTPRDLSRTIAPSRYPNALLTGYLINLPSLRRRQDLRTSHVNLDNFIHGNIAGRTTAMQKLPGLSTLSFPR